MPDVCFYVPYQEVKPTCETVEYYKHFCAEISWWINLWGYRKSNHLGNVNQSSVNLQIIPNVNLSSLLRNKVSNKNLREVSAVKEGFIETVVEIKNICFIFFYNLMLLRITLIPLLFCPFSFRRLRLFDLFFYLFLVDVLHGFSATQMDSSVFPV